MTSWLDVAALQAIERFESKAMKLRGALARQGKVVASVEHLHLVAQQMYLATDSVFDSQDEADWNGTATSSLAHVMPEEMLAGKFIEVKSCTLLYCGFQEARRAMWQRMFNQQQQMQHQQHCDAVSSESSAMEVSDHFKLFALEVESLN